MSSSRRRAEISKVNEEGRRAARAGKHIQTNPYHFSKTMDAMHWAEAYRLEKEQMEYEDGFMGDIK